MPTDHIRYDLLVQEALRSVVRKVLGDAARNGLPGEHHFKISFTTQAPGVAIPASMRQKYPDEMTIILQHEFWDLSVNGENFEVSLSFSRKPERLTIPFAAITGFSDPSVPTFGFKFMAPEIAEPSASSVEKGTKASDRGEDDAAFSAKRSQVAGPTPRALVSAKPIEPPEGPAVSKASEKPEAAKVVSIDAFRKK
jgi:uncharacterized protein